MDKDENPRYFIFVLLTHFFSQSLLCLEPVDHAITGRIVIQEVLSFIKSPPTLDRIHKFLYRPSYFICIMKKICNKWAIYYKSKWKRINPIPQIKDDPMKGNEILYSTCSRILVLVEKKFTSTLMMTNMIGMKMIMENHQICPKATIGKDLYPFAMIWVGLIHLYLSDSANFAESTSRINKL